jgi:cell division protein FtsW (lipid II flippase)
MSLDFTPAPISRRETILLIIAGVFVFLGMLALSLTRDTTLGYWAIFGVWVACAISGTMILNHHLPKRDTLLFPLAMFFSGWGLVLIERLAPFFADRQAIWLILSVIAMLLTAISPHILHWLRNYRYILLALTLILLVSTIIFGRNPSGNAFAPQLWLGIGSIFFQPSEVMKITIVAFLASYLGEQSTTLRTKSKQSESFGEYSRFSISPRLIGPMLLMWGLSVVILIRQRDLGTAMLFFIVFILLLYVSSGDIRILIGGVLLVIIAGFIAYQLFSVVQLRIDIWLNPWPEADGRAYQIVQSLLAFGSGGIFGAGVGQGFPGYIPVVHSDFVFSALAEEWGLLGVITVLSGFAILVMRGLRISMTHSGRPFYTLLAVGLTMMLAVQSLLIMGGVLKVLPLTGVTLPFISYGGSSLLISFIMLGLLLRLSSEVR